MATVNTEPVTTPAPTTTTRQGAGRLEMLGTATRVPMSPNPFAVPAVLPGIVISFLLATIAVAVGAYNTYSLAICGGLMVLGTGFLLIGALVQRGEIELNEAGVVLRRGKETISAPWNRVAGISHNRAYNQLEMELVNPALSHKKMRLPGGLRTTEDRAIIPLRYFGNRQNEVIDACAEHLSPEQMSVARDYCERTGFFASKALLVVTTVICCACVIAVAVVMNP